MTFQSFPKPDKGAFVLERKAKRRDVDTFEKNEKAKARKRDSYRCRWPKCPYCALKVRKEVAHMKAKGIGGDHGLRSTADQLVTFCYLIHQGANSLHSGDKKVHPLTPNGANGPMAFWQKQQSGAWTCVGKEAAVGVLER